MDPLPELRPADMSDAQLRTLARDLEHRRPPAKVAGAGMRPDRRPWSYRDIWLLEAVVAEMARRGLR